MASPQVRLEVEGLDDHIRQLQRMGVAMAGAVLEAALAGGGVIEERANQNLGRTDAVKVELNARETTAKRVVVEIGLVKEKWFLRFRETGTSPHEISPKNAIALSGYDGSGIFFSAGHEVGGMAANPFMRPAVDSSLAAVRDAMRQVYERTQETAAK